MQILFAFISGLVFGLGLLISGMANPGKVLAFLDLRGSWDPSLAFVMAGAILVASVGFWLARRRKMSFLGCDIQIPKSSNITPQLVLGSVVFGIGWGLVGFCPGPALVAASLFTPKALAFVAAMVGGMLIYETVQKPTS